IRVTPFCWASFAIATPVGPSSGHTIRILAPRLMSAVASLSWVASLPCALSMRNSAEVYPAAVKACRRYGASKLTYRVDDVVSGRTTPTCRLLAPFVPAAASALNRDIVGVMLTVKESMLTDGTVVEPAAAGDEADEVDVAAGVDVLDEDEQPAAIRPRAAARATQPSRGKRRNLPSPCERESRPPPLLLPSIIPYALSLNAPNKSTRDTTIHNRAPALLSGIVGRDARNVPLTRP